jgi:hypothetical protein
VAEGDVVSRLTALRAAGGAVCLALAVFAVLLARDVWHVHTGLATGDARDRLTPVDTRSWSADTLVPGGLARSVLGVGDDLAFRALMARGRTMTAPATNDQARRRRFPVEEALALEEQDPDRVRASQAANLLGIFYSTDPNEPNRPAAQKALAEFVTAVRLDPTNETAKSNLELMLEQSAADRLRGRKGASAGEAPGNAGAGRRQGGNGY